MFDLPEELVLLWIDHSWLAYGAFDPVIRRNTEIIVSFGECQVMRCSGIR